MATMASTTHTIIPAGHPDRPMSHGPAGAPSRGSLTAPGLRWLFAPGEPLAEPPRRWAADVAGHGPDPAWFSEVFAGVMGAD